MKLANLLPTLCSLNENRFRDKMSRGWDKLKGQQISPHEITNKDIQSLHRQDYSRERSNKDSATTSRNDKQIARSDEKIFYKIVELVKQINHINRDAKNDIRSDVERISDKAAPVFAQVTKLAKQHTILKQLPTTLIQDQKKFINAFIQYSRAVQSGYTDDTFETKYNIPLPSPQ